MAQVLSLPIEITPMSSSEDAAAIARIELTPEESEAALSAARWQKYERLKAEYQKAERERIRHDLTRPWDWGYMLNFVKQRAEKELGLTLDLSDPETSFLYGAICRYFVGDPSFETMGANWKLSKGLMLMGGVGTGKTTIMKLFARNKRMSFDLLSCRRAAEMYEKDGEEAIGYYSNIRYDLSKDPRYFYQTDIGQCFDDLGTEKTPVKHYGNTTDVMADVLLNRYDKAKGSYIATHITTNLLPDEIEQKYGTRVRSRMRQMFNVISVTGDDRRASL